MTGWGAARFTTELTAEECETLIEALMAWVRAPAISDNLRAVVAASGDRDAARELGVIEAGLAARAADRRRRAEGLIRRLAAGRVATPTPTTEENSCCE